MQLYQKLFKALDDNDIDELGILPFTPDLENVTRVMILLKPDNYTAMNTRKRLIQLGHIDPKKELDLIKLFYSAKALKNDYSSFNHLQQIIERLAVDQDQTRQEQHMQWLNQLIIKYPGHESLWCHRRFCSHLFVKSKDYCHAQHQFIQSILSDQHKDEALSNNEDSFKSQREQALKFGLWQSIMEKRTYGQVLSQSLLEDYARVAPIANFL
ncbi:hypothetical protein EDC96DRAFT_533540 [Choanephora cucurbitarum]|nr:hypothetical protein EDC96DRAFT_533540 [Choanephora cucurbitarum]